MSPAFGQEYRVHNRRGVRLEVRVRLPASARSYDALMMNVGLGGGCIEIARFLGDVRIGERAALAFSAQTLWDPLEITGRVVWIRVDAPPAAPMRFGVAFEHRDAAATLALFELIAGMSFD